MGTLDGSIDGSIDGSSDGSSDGHVDGYFDGHFDVISLFDVIFLALFSKTIFLKSALCQNA